MTAKKPRRQYKDANGKKLPGVTTILGVLDKPLLIPWAARLAAEATAAAIVDGGMPADRAIEVGKKAPFARRQEAADAGTQAHACVEAHYAGEPWPEDASDAARACAQRVIDHIAARGYDVVVSEWSGAIGEHGNGFAGTLDLIVDRDGLRYIADLKTGKAAFDEVVPQLAAYAQMWRHYSDRDRKTDHPFIDGGIVFHAPIEGDVVNEIELTREKIDAGWRLFDAARAAYWARKDAKLPTAEKDGDE